MWWIIPSLYHTKLIRESNRMRMSTYDAWMNLQIQLEVMQDFNPEHRYTSWKALQWAPWAIHMRRNMWSGYSSSFFVGITYSHKAHEGSGCPSGNHSTDPRIGNLLHWTTWPLAWKGWWVGYDRSTKYSQKLLHYPCADTCFFTEIMSQARLWHISNFFLGKIYACKYGLWMLERII